MKLVIADPKTGKSYQVEVPKESTGRLIGVKLGEIIEGGFVGATSYKLQVTGGSDKDGFPMRRDVPGSRRDGFLLSSGPGFNPRQRGERKRKKVRGTTISEEIMQVNTKVTEYGDKPLDAIFAKEKAEEKKE